MKFAIKSFWSAALLLVFTAHAVAGEQETTFSIRQFHISGNQLLSTETLQVLVSPYIGDTRTSADIRSAQKAIENAYLAAGYGTVRAVTPEQELTDGVVQLKVVEAKIQKVTVIGNSHFNEANIRASVPSLKEGDLPNLREISENVQLANENPAKRAEVLLNSQEEEGALEARVLVNDENPLRLSASLDNTGNQDTGRTRAGIAMQHANLFDRDHVATLAYITSPEEMDKVDIYSLSYRLPIYALGDSIDFIYGYSTVDSGSTQTVAGPLNFSGSGHVLALRYNHYFARKGEFSSRLSLGLDRRAYHNSCDFGDISCGGEADTDITVRPVSLTWIGQLMGSGKRRDLYASFAHNISGGENGHSEDFEAARSGAKSNYKVLRYGVNLVQDFGAGWQGHAALNGQYAPQPLVAGEQLGIAGASMVRGFNERALSVDTGWVGNLELYSPNFGGNLGLSDNKSLRGLLFADVADGRNREVTSPQTRHATLASAGVGLRADMSNRVSFRLDIASVIHSQDNAGENPGDVRGHFALNILF